MLYYMHSENKVIIIQLMHSFEVDIRICQPENSDVHRGEAEVTITFEGWLWAYRKVEDDKHLQTGQDGHFSRAPKIIVFSWS